MGADITFENDKGSFYFRDSYNLTNLAWVIKLSYWKALAKTDKTQLKKAKEFFKKLKEITDEEIKTYTKHLFKDKRDEIAQDDTEQSFIKMFKEKRGEIRKHWKRIENATEVSWSV